MAALSVVEALDVVEDGAAQLGLCRLVAAVDEVALEGLEERFAEGVVVGAAAIAHRLFDAGLAAAGPSASETYCEPWSE